MTRLQTPIAPILILRGPRQIGKTTLQQQIVAQLLRDGVQSSRILRIQFDDLPSLSQIDPNGEPEVDFIITIGEKRIPLEIKYRKVIDPLRDTLGLRLFIEKATNNAPFSLLVTRDDKTTVNDSRIVCLPLKSLLMVR